MASASPLFPSSGISDRAAKVGFRFGAKGTHTSRTMMFDELAAVLAAAPETASREDYAAAKSGTARFRSGQMERTIFVPLVDDATPELEEFFTLQLSSRAVKIGGEPKVVITIRDDD